MMSLLIKRLIYSYRFYLTSFLLNVGLVMFPLKHLFFGPLAAPSLLTTYLFNGLLPSAGRAFLYLVDFVRQAFSRPVSVHSLGAFFLTANNKTGRVVREDHAG